MDLSEELDQLSRNEQKSKVRNKNLIEMSSKKYRLQKELKELGKELPEKTVQLKALQDENLLLSAQVSTLAKCDEITRNDKEKLLYDTLCQEAATERLQKRFWGTTNRFVTDANRHLEVIILGLKKNKINNRHQDDILKQTEKLKQMRFKGELEAVALYANYQAKIIDRLKGIKDILRAD